MIFSVYYPLFHVGCFLGNLCIYFYWMLLYCMECIVLWFYTNLPHDFSQDKFHFCGKCLWCLRYSIVCWSIMLLQWRLYEIMYTSVYLSWPRCCSFIHIYMSIGGHLSRIQTHCFHSQGLEKQWVAEIYYMSVFFLRYVYIWI